MDIFKLMQKNNTHEVVFFEEPSVSLRGIMAIHNTVLGPALATCRIFDFGSAEKAAETVLKMGFYNTHRAALLRRAFGGGGIVLCGDPLKLKNEMYFRALGVFVNKMNGKLFLVRNSGITYKDMLDIKRESDYLLGIDENYLLTGNSPVDGIVKGMIWGLKAIVREKFNKATLSGLSFAVQGVGEVGSKLVKKLISDYPNVKITITDIVYDKIKALKDEFSDVKVVKPKEIYHQKADVFISCAFNNIITKDEIRQINAKVVTSSVNELFENPEDENILKERDIFYVPGFVINGGEIILLQNELQGKDPKIAEKELQEIYYITWELIQKAKKQNKTVREVALKTAADYINQVAIIKQLK